MQPQWNKPAGLPIPGLKVNNSLKNDELQDFIPTQGKLVRWYYCGPTVYDDSHLGHARSYLSFDILRRIMEDYFGYHVFACMNITDLDDKIIIKSRQNYLFDDYSKKNPIVDQLLLETLTLAWQTNIESLKKKLQKLQEDVTSGKRKVVESQPERQLYESKLEEAEKSLVRVRAAKEGEPSLSLLEKAQSVLSAYLDNKESARMDSELVKRLCDQHAKKYELAFFKDMRALGIRDPDVLVRVTEYVPHIVSYVQQILDKGYAYESQGSVYFDTVKFHNSENHTYGKLKPEAVGNLDMLMEGEGGLTTTTTNERKTSKDFALWKSSKPGEPSWDSPWGKGRPGWHIECSAMASKILGHTIDVHCGGCDLKFPHHDNELAQSEAYFDCYQWINYFFHAGHLNIDGLKMSKSLKNFITIREAFEAGHTATQIRFLFLIQEWDKDLNYQRVNTMEEVDTKIKTFTEFFRKVHNLDSTVMINESWVNEDENLHATFLEAQESVHKSLCRNFDTKSVIQHLISLVSGANKYMTNNPTRKG
eukprot:TRINITY_DN163_c0_g1_i1.p1 TRINITY_DN163_c0_g1~~TRINITY_DN163_c0_g1_i1.p1  ORF type:complete len:534 (-),score=99.44 TRINITY_DN163_c0_g1_i1:806-2407(-)